MQGEDAIEDYRREVDHLDKDILDMLNQRFSIVSKISEIKKQRGLDIENKEREDKILRRLISHRKDLDEDFIKEYMEIILKYSKKKQK